MAAIKYDLSIEQGSSFQESFVYRDQNQQIINITNWCARLTLTTNDGNLYTFTTENTDLSLYKMSIDGPNGKIVLSIPASTTNQFNFYTGKYDLELQSDQELYAGGGKTVVRSHYGVVVIVKRYGGANTALEC